MRLRAGRLEVYVDTVVTAAHGDEPAPTAASPFPDPTRDGAWRGFAAGAGGGLLMSYAMYTRLDLCPTPPASVLLVAGLFGAAGVWIGVGVDRLTQTEVRWPATTPGAWRAAPLLTPEDRGVAVWLSF